jgi:ABC-type branched-subunit amino acid transport system substrate-binding protein
MSINQPVPKEQPDPIPELTAAGWLALGLSVLAAIWLLGAAIRHVRAAQAPPTVKIGLVAPFEGEYRSTGYEVLFAVKLALQQRNQGKDCPAIA